METFELLDRFELLYPTNGKLSDLRRSYIDKDLSSIFRLTKADEDLRKAIIEENLHSIFRLTKADEDLRKAIIEENLHSIFRLLPNLVSGDVEELRKAVIEKNLHSIFRLVDDEELRKAVIEKNLHSIFRLVDDEDLRKLLLEDNNWKLWTMLDRYVDTQFVDAFKSFFVNNIDIDKDCFSRGQLESKLWLIKELKKLDVDLGTVFLCAGWYATLAVMLFESNIKVDKIRSFDIDESCKHIAETFNKPWILEDWRFKPATYDIHDINYDTFEYTVTRSNGTPCDLTDSPDTVINTSCEHIENFAEWYAKIPQGKIVILQSNDYFEIDDHINCSENLTEFSASASMTETLFEGELELPLYTRFMKIGVK